jgi:hypothetical protein
MNNYILARWRDAITDPPPEGKPRLVKSHYGVIQHVLFERVGNRWTHADLELGDSEGWDGCDIEPGDQWLDVTAIPAVARAKVQAAVDEIADIHAASLINECLDDVFSTNSILKRIANHTGVTPSEVK